MDEIVKEIAKKLNVKIGTKVQIYNHSDTEGLWMATFRIYLCKQDAETKSLVKKLGLECMTIKENFVPENHEYIVVILHTPHEKLILKRYISGFTKEAWETPVATRPLCIVISKTFTQEIQCGTDQQGTQTILEFGEIKSNLSN